MMLATATRELLGAPWRHAGSLKRLPSSSKPWLVEPLGVGAYTSTATTSYCSRSRSRQNLTSVIINSFLSLHAFDIELAADSLPAPNHYVNVCNFGLAHGHSSSQA